MFQLSQLRCFVAVSAELNFRRAATRLNMTQPPVTRQIQLLEHGLGVKLLERSGRNVQLTAAGAHFLVEAQDILSRAHAAAQSARLVGRGDGGTIVVGGLPFANITLMPLALARLRKRYPGIKVTLREMTTYEQAEALSSGSIELGLMRHPKNARSLKLERVMSERIRLFLHRDHPLARNGDPSLLDLEGHRLLMHSTGPGWYIHDIVQGLLTEANVRADIGQYLDSTQTMMAMVNAGAGIALLPESATAISYGDLVWRDIRLPRRARLESWLATAEGSRINPALQKVRDAIMAAGAELQAIDGPVVRMPVPIDRAAIA